MDSTYYICENTISKGIEIMMRNTSHAESLVQEMDNALAKSSEDNDITCWNSFQQVV